MFLDVVRSFDQASAQQNGAVLFEAARTETNSLEVKTSNVAVVNSKTASFLMFWDSLGGWVLVHILLARLDTARP